MFKFKRHDKKQPEFKDGIWFTETPPVLTPLPLSESPDQVAVIEYDRCGSLGTEIVHGKELKVERFFRVKKFTYIRGNRNYVPLLIIHSDRIISIKITNK